MNTSISTFKSMSSTSSFTCSSDPASFVEESHEGSDYSFLYEVSMDDGEDEDEGEVTAFEVREATSYHQEEQDPFLFELDSFPTNTTVSESSSQSLSVAPALFPEMIDVNKSSSSVQCHRRLHSSDSTAKSLSSPYAQLCFDPGHKTLITMLENHTSKNGKKRPPRLPLDGPTPEDFPWLRQPSPSLTSAVSNSSGSNSTVSSLSGGRQQRHSYQQTYCEPIVLCGPWMLEGSLSDEEADIYWLLHEGEDVWVNLDEGCIRALKKAFTSCGQWKLLKRGLWHYDHQQNSATCSDNQGREEQRCRYSVLN